MSDPQGFLFGLVADIQYACKVLAASVNAVNMFMFGNGCCATQGISHTEGRSQRYEEVPQKLAQAVHNWHRDEPKLQFVLSLGDIIDGRETQVQGPRAYHCTTSSEGCRLAKLSIQIFRLRLMKTSLISKTYSALW